MESDSQSKTDCIDSNWSSSKKCLHIISTCSITSNIYLNVIRCWYGMTTIVQSKFAHKVFIILHPFRTYFVWIKKQWRVRWFSLSNLILNSNNSNIHEYSIQFHDKIKKNNGSLNFHYFSFFCIYNAFTGID